VNLALAFGDFMVIEDRTVPFEHDDVWIYPLLKSFPNNLYAAKATFASNLAVWICLLFS
jgi:hypothetical protein